MGRLKRWLINKYLPAWARDALWEENKKLQALVEELEKELEQRDTYIAGMENMARWGKRVTIRMEDGRK